jgi:exonuclease SbcC
MILKSVEIENIRSIEKIEDLEFPDSSILFYGDIGSGKSSVLKAIEFALFGTMGDLPGDSLLRRGTKKGSVKLTFEIDGNSYTIHRKLERVMRGGDKSVTQPEGSLIENGSETSYTTTELREKILSLFNYSLDRYRAHNKKCIDIFRYTVYTPQEEIKQILEADAEQRFEILKDVFNIEKYENTLNNLSLIKTELNRDIKYKKAELKAIGEPEKEIPNKKNIITKKQKEIKEKEEELSNNEMDLKKNKFKLEKMRDKLEKISIDFTKCESNDTQITNLNSQITNKSDTIENLREKIKSKTEELNNLPKIELKTKKSLEELNTQLEDLRTEQTNLKNTEAIKKERIENYKNILENDRCPTCKQKVHEKERFKQDLAKMQTSLDHLGMKIEKNKQQISNTKDLLDNLRKYKENKNQIQNFQEIIKEQKERKNDLDNTIKSFKASIDQAKQEINQILDSYKLKQIEDLMKLKQQHSIDIENQTAIVEDLQVKNSKLRENLATFNTEIEQLKKELKELKQNIEKKDKLKDKVKYLTQVRDWIDKQFPVLLRDIERTILNTTAHNFNQYFKQWFGSMVETPEIEIKINPENFDPEIYIDGYLSPFRDLSGGEKSALSLSYRLALNRVITEKNPNIKTKDILILDEPTDGFSQEQVNKMQEIFEKLDMRQLIIISHDRGLDSFVTDIYNFTKSHHKTKIVHEESTEV